MSQSVGVSDITFISGSPYGTSQYYLVKMDTTANQVILGTGHTDKVIGVLQNDPLKSESAVVRVVGTTKVVTGTPIAAGQLVTCDSAGKATTPPADKDWVIGIALEASAASGDIIEILLCPHVTGV